MQAMMLHHFAAQTAAKNLTASIGAGAQGTYFEKYCNYDYISGGPNPITTDRCKTIALTFCDNGDLVNFYALHFCLFSENKYFFMASALIIIFFIFRYLALIVDEYCAEGITLIAKWLQFSQSLAGVTLLAFANGAGDVLTALVASDAPEGVFYNVGSIYGAGVFVCCIVVAGAVFRKGEIEYSPLIVYRDLSFYIAATLLTLLFGYYGKITVWGSLSLLSLYIIQVLVVLYQDSRKEDDDDAKKLSMQYHQESDGVRISSRQTQVQDSIMLDGLVVSSRRTPKSNFKDLKSQENENQDSPKKSEKSKKNVKKMKSRRSNTNQSNKSKKSNKSRRSANRSDKNSSKKSKQLRNTNSLKSQDNNNNSNNNENRGSEEAQGTEKIDNNLVMYRSKTGTKLWGKLKKSYEKFQGRPIEAKGAEVISLMGTRLMIKQYKKYLKKVKRAKRQSERDHNIKITDIEDLNDDDDDDEEETLIWKIIDFPFTVFSWLTILPQDLENYSYLRCLIWCFTGIGFEFFVVKKLDRWDQTTLIVFAVIAACYLVSFLVLLRPEKPSPWGFKWIILNCVISTIF